MATYTVSCVGCGDDIKNAKGNRLLNTKSSKHALSLWKEIIKEEINQQGTVTENLNIETLTTTGGICRHCSSKYERAAKLIDRIKSDIVSSVNTLLDHLEPQQPSTPNRSRSTPRTRFLTSGKSPGVKSKQQLDHILYTCFKHLTGSNKLL